MGCSYDYNQFSSPAGNTGGNESTGDFSQGGASAIEATAATGGDKTLGGASSTDIVVATGGDRALGGASSTDVVVATGGIPAQGGANSTDVVVATGGARQGFSRALVEAQAMGRPVVAEDGGGAAETVLPGVTGWLAPEGDPAALAEALQSALSLTIERRAELARAAQEQARSRYGLARANRQLIELYERLAQPA